MKTISFETLVERVSALVADTNYFLPGDILGALKEARGAETSGPGGAILDQIVENARIAAEDALPLCQDTGVAVYFVEIGEEARVESPGIEAALQEGTRRGYRNGALRMSMVRDPLRRGNTGDNTPAVIHYAIVPGDGLRIVFCPKGGGCENMSRLAMLSPGEGCRGVVEFVLDTVRRAGGKPCPPLLVGVGIGGDFERSAELAKRALLRTAGERHADPFYADLEMELLAGVNALGIGPMGLGGATTALDVFIETAPCHIASLPLAVNIQCHSARHGRIEF
jgi:fumarate hydratase subunit alpha